MFIEGILPKSVEDNRLIETILSEYLYLTCNSAYPKPDLYPQPGFHFEGAQEVKPAENTQI